MTETVTIDGAEVQLASMEHIAAMKAGALLGRAEKRDYIDVFAICSQPGWSARRFIENARQRLRIHPDVLARAMGYEVMVVLATELVLVATIIVRPWFFRVAVDDALQALLNADEGREQRQLHGVDSEETFAFSGAECQGWFGHRVGENYTVAGNLLTGEARDFTAYFEAEVEIEKEFDSPMTVADGSNNITVTVDPTMWFERGDGTVVDLSQYDFDPEAGSPIAEFEVEIESSAGESFTEIEHDG